MIRSINTNVKHKDLNSLFNYLNDNGRNKYAT